VGQQAAVRQVQSVLKRGWGGRAWWITGPSGSGKTTLARIIASEGADEYAVEELDAKSLTPAAVAGIVREAYPCRCLGAKGGKVFVVNESHGLRKDTIRALLTAIEPPGGLPQHVIWIFTTTKAGQESLFEDDITGDAAPLLSRCVEVELRYDDQSRAAYAQRAQTIARAEGIDGLPLSVYATAVDASKGNLRRVLQRIESGAFKADAVECLEREYAAVQSTKGDWAAKRRAELTAAIEAAKR
jgi:replication-associated recombination protein RarA